MPRVPKLTIDRDAFSKLIRPWAERLVTDIAATLTPKIEALLEDARTDAIARLEAAFAPASDEVDEIEEPPAEAVQPARKSARPPAIVANEKPAPRAEVVHRDPKPTGGSAKVAANGKAWPSCSICGRVGVTARSHPHEAKASRVGAIAKASRERADKPIATAGDNDPAEEEEAVAPALNPSVAILGPTSKGRSGRSMLGSRSRSIPVKWSRARVRATLGLDVDAAPVDVVRPATRGDCVDGHRPCPFVGCRHHLYLDIIETTGSLRLVFGSEIEPWDLAESCSLDVADRGALVLDDVGRLMNVTRERTRQIELPALANLRAALVANEVDETALAAFGTSNMDGAL